MNGSDRETLVEKAKSIYEQRLRDQLQRTHPEAFVAVEPLSGDYFLGATLSEAVGAARLAHPDRLVHTMRVGHKAALHFGYARFHCHERAC
jgi:hypothetical protein